MAREYITATVGSPNRPDCTEPGSRLPAAQGRLKNARDLFVIVVVGLTLYLPYLGQQHYLASHEMRHAEIAREMASSGDMVVSTLLGHRYADKPPGLYIAVASLYRMNNGPSLALARAPSVSAAISAAVALYLLALLFDDRRCALLAALGLMSIGGYSAMARDARPDMAMTATLLIACLCAGYGMASKSAARRAILFGMAGIACAVSILVKGPVGPVCFAIFVGAATLDRSLKFPILSEWVILVGAMLAVLSIWIIPAFLRDHGAYLMAMLQQRDLSMTPDNKTHSPVWYVGVVPQRFLPFTLFCPLLIFDVRSRGWRPALTTALLLLVILSVAPKKRVQYPLPVYPFLTLAVAESIFAFGRRWIIQGAVVLTAAWLIGTAVFFDLIQRRLVTFQNPAMLVAPSLLNLIPSHTSVVSFGDIAEAIAFVGRRDRVSEVNYYSAMLPEIKTGGVGGYVVIPEKDCKAILAKIDAQATLTPEFAEQLPLSSKPRGWKVYRVDAIK